MHSARAANRKLVTDFFVRAFVEEDAAGAAERFLHPAYVEHSPRVPTGPAGFASAAATLHELYGEGARLRILRTVADADYAAVHSCTGDGAIRMDLYRIEEGRIAEHWDAAKTMVDPATIPHGNGETETVATDTESDAETNRRNAVLFYDLAFVQKRYIEAADEFFGDRYIQHNSFVADGIEAYKQHFGESETHRSSRYCQIPIRFVADDDYALVQVFLRKNLDEPGERGIAIYDLFRYDRGRIVEHWDVGAAILDPAELAHPNGML